MIFRYVCLLPVLFALTSRGYGSPQVSNLVNPDQEKVLDQLVHSSLSSSIEKIFVFGDSLSDTGNLNRRTLGLYIPKDVFYQNRFSNGPIWIDYISSSLTTSVENFAVGGAETGAKSGIEYLAIPSTERQIWSAKWQLKWSDPETSLVVLWVGANNYFNDSRDDPETTINDIQKQIETLVSYGVKNIIVGSMPELGDLPDEPGVEGGKTDAEFFALTARHNLLLDRMLERINEELPKPVVKFQAAEINQKTIDDPQAFGFSNLSSACYQGNLQGDFYFEEEFCSDPLGVKFWDYTHPNSKMHCFYASQFLSDLARSQSISFDFEAGIRECLDLETR